MENAITLIDQFRNKAGAWQSQSQADRIKIKLKDILPNKDYQKLSTAHSHYLLGEGAAELYSICQQLSKKFK